MRPHMASAGVSAQQVLSLRHRVPAESFSRGRAAASATTAARASIQRLLLPSARRAPRGSFRTAPQAAAAARACPASFQAQGAERAPHAAPASIKNRRAGAATGQGWGSLDMLGSGARLAFVGARHARAASINTFPLWPLSPVSPRNIPWYARSAQPASFSRKPVPSFVMHVPSGSGAAPPA